MKHLKNMKEIIKDLHLVIINQILLTDKEATLLIKIGHLQINSQAKL
jgi:hypothetical protein